MAETSAHRVAKLILNLAHTRGVEMTNLKLQKLLYYSQAWHLAILRKPLFSERIEAWVHGPAVPAVFGAYKQFRWNPIPDPGLVTIEAGDSRWPIEHHVVEVLDAYAALSGPELERLTHREDPWKLARLGLPADMPSHNVISPQSMIDFYGPKVGTAG